MDFAFTPEHEELRQTVRKFLADKSTEAQVRRLMATEEGSDPEVWSQLAGQLGLPALTVAEEHGGAGLGPVEMAIVMEEMGRALLCAPYLSSAVLAVAALQQVGTPEAQAELLPEIAAGSATATLAVAEAGRGWEVENVHLTATRSGDGWVLDGTKEFVIDGHTATHLLVVARGEEGISLFHVRGDADGVERTLLPTLDLTRKLARLTFRRAVARPVANPGDQREGLRHTLTLALIALAAEQVGGAQRCLEMATEYARTRLQFGRPIGSFQAIKHKCADMLVAVEFARSAAYHAAFRAADGNDRETRLAAGMAKSYCSEAYFQVANDNIQVHGGMGFTWEHPAHLYFKRAKSSALMFGDPTHHRRQVASAIGI